MSSVGRQPPPGRLRDEEEEIRFALLRWYGSFGTFAVPQAAAPIAFALVALPLTGDPNSGAAMILAMTVAQLVAAVPLARLGRPRHAVVFLRSLILVRAVALGTVAVLAATGAPFPWLVVAAAVAGSVNGAAFGFLRSVLNFLVKAGRLPRALGIAATLNELVFVTAPVLASALGALSPVMAVVALTCVGAAPLVLLPAVPQATSVDTSSPSGSGIMTPSILLWLLCAAATSASVAAIEIGAVALAVGFGLEPALGFVFPVALCLGSVAGGVWVSVRNRVPARRTVVLYLIATTMGSALIAWIHSVALTMLASVVVGFLLPPLATYYQLVLDGLAPPDRRAEVFAQLRNATSIGVITISLTLTLWSLRVALMAAALSILIATLSVVTVQAREPGRR